MTSSDVIVCGGGPAGATAAILLARAGLAVELYEQHRFPREKPCGEGIMPAGVGVLERLGVREAVGGVPLPGVRYVGWGRSLETAFPRLPGLPAAGLGQRRLTLDRALFDAAAATPGVRAHEGVRVEGPLVLAGRVRGVRVGGEERRARLVVAADGSRSPLRRALALDGPAERRPRIGVRAHFRLADGVTAPDRVEVHLGEGHELYVTPLPDRVVLVAGLAARHEVDGSVARAFRGWIERHPSLRARLEGAEPVDELAGRLPLRSRARQRWAPGLVLLGDAAGFVDAVTGSGMAQALVSAELLARTLAPAGGATFDPGDDRLAAFDRARRALLADYERLTRFVLALSKSPWLARGSLRLFATFPALFRHLVGVAGGTHPLLPG